MMLPVHSSLHGVCLLTPSVQPLPITPLFLRTHSASSHSWPILWGMQYMLDRLSILQAVIAGYIQGGIQMEGGSRTWDTQSD